jgi:3',5'-cyclic AMP phosphodiesterase CpdA
LTVHEEQAFDLEISRRKLLAAAGLSGAAAAASSLVRTGDARAATNASPAPDPLTTPPVAGLHLQFGADASSEMVASWHTLQPVRNPRVLLGQLDGTLKLTVNAKVVSYTDAKSGRVVHAYHAKLERLLANHSYLYAAIHDGAEPVFSTFRTSPRGRAPFSFTSFGDQGTPTLGRKYVPPAGEIMPNPPFVNDNLGSPAAANTTLGVERLRPLFHLFNGDLCYANIAEDRVQAWWDFWENNSRSACKRPWMPCAGNHENELGNGPIGYRAFQTYFSVPEATGQTDMTRGLWYAFTAGSVRVISIANDDVCYQDGGNSYVRGYSSGAQKAWLEHELSASRADRNIDWLVVCMHQVAISTAEVANGADLGIRQEWLPLFDQFGVDLVVCGHEHHYERSHPIRGTESNSTLTPVPSATALEVIDTSQGTVHMVIGGGGTSAPTNQQLFSPPQCRVITGVGEPDTATGRRPSIYKIEQAPWSAVRNAGHSYGFAAFSVDPGPQRGGITTIKVTYFDVLGPDGQLSPFESFTLRRHRRD